MTVASAVSVASEYDRLAPHYDLLTVRSDYGLWTRTVLELARSLGLNGRSLLDLACGTGKSFLTFRALGFEVTGCDVSAAMLAQAARKAPDATLVQADLRELGRLGDFDLVTCFDDSLNYLLDERGLGRALAAIGANLAPAGLALFDLNTLLAYRTTFAETSVLESGGVVFAWRGETTRDAEPGCRADAVVDAFVPRDDGAYDRVATRHAQRHFPPGRVTALMRGAGLECVGVHGVLEDGTLEPRLDEARHPKVLYAARRAKGGDLE